MLKKIVTQDQNLQLIQDNVDSALTPLQNAPLSGGNFISVSVSSGSNKIAHQLGRVPTRWSIMDITMSATIYRTAWDSTYLYLDSSAGGTISLWVN